MEWARTYERPSHFSLALCVFLVLSMKLQIQLFLIPEKSTKYLDLNQKRCKFSGNSIRGISDWNFELIEHWLNTYLNCIGLVEIRLARCGSLKQHKRFESKLSKFFATYRLATRPILWNRQIFVWREIGVNVTRAYWIQNCGGKFVLWR